MLVPAHCQAFLVIKHSCHLLRLPVVLNPEKQQGFLPSTPTTRLLGGERPTTASWSGWGYSDSSTTVSRKLCQESPVPKSGQFGWSKNGVVLIHVWDGTAQGYMWGRTVSSQRTHTGRLIGSNASMQTPKRFYLNSFFDFIPVGLFLSLCFHSLKLLES